MARVAIFIDGGYLTALAKEFGVWVDYGKLPGEIQSIIAAKTPEPVDLLRTYHYDCPPYQSNPPTTDERQRTARALSFYEFLKKLPRFTLRQGVLKFRGLDKSGRPIFQQKRVDLMLGLDFALLSAKKQITHAAIIAGDSDLVPALEVAANEGLAVWLFHGPSKSQIDGTASYASELWHSADERVEIDLKFMQRIARVKEITSKSD